jgi:hypothetical protein
VTAQELDKYYNETGRLVGPLHGMCVTNCNQLCTLILHFQGFPSASR